MAMLIDATTLSDLEVFHDSAGRGGLFALLDETETEAGRIALRGWMDSPHSDLEAMRATQAGVRFFLEHPTAVRLTAAANPALPRYLDSNIVRSSEAPGPGAVVGAYWISLRYSDLFRELREGVLAARLLIQEADAVARRLQRFDPPPTIAANVQRMIEICERCAPALGAESRSGLLRSDRMLRGILCEDVKELVAWIGELDALRSMARATSRLGWVMPELVESDRFVMEAEGLVHPFVENPVDNPVDLGGAQPMVFLTGPNMAGKTTYLRSAALLVLLAQMGMSVPARRARLSPVQVLLTSLNPADNLRAGLSFFLAEVLRVQDAAQHLAAGRRCFVLFDEVFKGTNVKDALEASGTVILGFSRATGSGFIFSSHLTELVATLRSAGGVRFHHFDGRLVDGRAHYSYRLRRGVSDERMGLQLLKEANIPGLLAEISA